MSLPPFTRAVKWLVIINAAVFLLVAVLEQFSSNLGETVSYYFALRPLLVLHGFLWQAVSYSFLHAGVLHILFNMLWLWWFGAQLELDWGYRKFLEFYFFCVIGAALTTIVVSYTGFGGITPATPTVGASGGILGILMAFGMLYGDQEIWLFPIPFSVKARYFVVGIVFLTLYGAITATRHRGESVAYVAHLGGLLFGYLYVRFLPRRGLSYATSEKYFGLRNSYYRWKRKRAARKFEVYMKERDRKVTFDEHGNYIPPDEDKKNGGSKSGWVN
ncbi:MAG: rhomboid family intramembrane serine protease [Acidobacteriia bacterium]|nr:rhomboid family intramembrane serine protease [Terriglobia bacterium]